MPHTPPPEHRQTVLDLLLEVEDAYVAAVAPTWTAAASPSRVEDWRKARQSLLRALYPEDQ